MKQNLNRKYKNQRKWEIEEAKANDGTYQLLRLFSRSTKMMIMHQDRALKKGYFSVEYEREGKPSGLANEDIEFFAFNFDLRDRFFIISSRLMRSEEHTSELQSH